MTDGDVSRSAKVVPPAWSARRWLVLTLAVTVAPFAVTIAFGPSAGDTAGPGLAWLLFVGSSVHVASSAWLYSLPEVADCARHARVRYYLAPIVLVAVLALAGALLRADQLAWVLVPFLAWQLFHFQRQNLGIAALAARASGARSLSGAERAVITGGAVAAITGLLARPERLQLAVDPHVHALFPVAAAAYATVLVTAIVQAERRRSRGDVAVAVALVLSGAFFAPAFVFGSPYAAVAGLTIAHGLQYLVLLGFVGAARQRTSVLAGASLLGVALLGGTLLQDASHLHDASNAVSRGLFGAYLGVVMAHFVIDAGLWRLRDPRASAFVGSYLPQLVTPTAITGAPD